MKIFSLDQLRQADKYTMEHQNISSDQLMERAGKVAFEWIHSQLGQSKVKIHVFCGVGNNGGDGLVIARYLLEHGYSVSTYVVNFSDHRSEDFLTNYDRIKNAHQWPQLLDQNSELPEISPNEIVVDAIFGIGLNRPPSKWVSKIMEHINGSRTFVLSIDIPSGLYVDKSIEEDQVSIVANYTLSFQFPKLVLMLPETGEYSQHWEVLNIGLDRGFISQEKPLAVFVDKSEALQRYRPRPKFSYKGMFGHSLVVGGSYGKIGAILMSSKAVLHAGAGLVSVFTPKCGYQIIQSSFPEAMVITDRNDEYIQNIEFDINPAVIGIGPGMGMNPKTVKAFENLLKKDESAMVPFVIDADGINIISENPEFLHHLKGRAVFTPHFKELMDLIGPWIDDFDLLKKMKEFSKANQVVLLVKGPHTITVFEDQIYVNSSGNPGMATAGSGDVLTGLICGLISQGYSLLDATVFGVYLHGMAGDLAAQKLGVEALTATDLIEFTGDAFLHLIQVNNPQGSTRDQSSQ